MKRFQLTFENRWRAYQTWMVAHPLVSVQILGVTILGVSVNRNFVQVEILNLCASIHS